jgi:hypothetical protein
MLSPHTRPSPPTASRRSYPRAARITTIALCSLAAAVGAGCGSAGATVAGAGTGGVQVAPLPAPVEPGRLVQGVTAEGILAQDGPRLGDGTPFVDWVFRAEAGQRVRVDLASSEFDTYLRIGRGVGGDFVLLQENDDAPHLPGGATDSRVTHTVDVAGDYVVRVTAFDPEEGGAYAVRVSSLPAALEAPRGGRIAPGATVRGRLEEIEAILDEDYPYQEWTLAAEAGARLSIETRSDDFDTFLSVGRRTPAGFEELAANDDWPGSHNGTDSRVVVTIADAGDYLLRVFPFDPDVRGAYEISVTPMPPLPAEPVTRPIAVGERVTGTLSDEDAQLGDGAPYQHWTFTGRAGDAVGISLSSSDFDTVLILGEIEGGVFREFASNDDANDSTDSHLDVILPVTGEYRIRVRPFAPDARGAYALEVLDLR